MRFIFSFFLAFLFFTTAPASAAPVFSVQFGSFESRAEAESSLTALVAKHSSMLGGLSTTIRETQLPPDNLPVYRTQAGPFSNREDAASICSQLSSSGDRCYVVESSEMPALLPVAAPIAAPASGAVAAAPDAALEASLDLAAAQAPSVKAPTPAPRKKSSFWSFLNPFSRDDEESLPTPSPAPASAPIPPSEAPAQAVPVDAVLTKDAPAESPAPAPAPSSESALPEAPVAAPLSSLQVPPPRFTPPYVIEEADRSATSSALVETPSPTEAPSLLPPATSSTPVSLSPAEVPSGAVQVEEAKRVPLSGTEDAAPAIPTLAQTMPPVDLHPSATIGKKSLWAHIYSFDSPQSALQYWENYRAIHPDFPVVRVRVISSYADRLQGNQRVSLRVGPFTRDGFITNLCSTITNPTLRCGAVVDLGIAASPASGHLPASRYRR